MPALADATGTNGTQFIQLILPFELDHASFFDKTQGMVDFVPEESLTIQDEDGLHVQVMVLINGIDADGVDHRGDLNWGQLSGVNTNPGTGKTSLIFVAQDGLGELDPVPDQQAFSVWSTSDEIRIHFKQARNTKGDLISLNSKWCILKGGSSPEPVEIVDIVATSPVLDGTGAPLLDPGTSLPLIKRDANFLVTFNKPVVPESVAQSIVFGGAPFNGNTRPVSSSLAMTPPPPGKNPCQALTNFDPVAPNISIKGELLFMDGSASGTSAIVPFRCYPLHQNNLSTYVLNPIIDLPGSSDLGNPPFGDPDVTSYTRLRIYVSVYDHDQNDVTGYVADTIPPSPPLNLGTCGLHRGIQAVGGNVEEGFIVAYGGRYVNAPVSPHALYYVMGSHGLGVVDLDGNGFTTNDPDFAKSALVTCQKYYSLYGNAGLGLGNNYAYAAKAVGGSSPTAMPPIGLGATTPMPGVNEGSDGIDTVVKDSNGNAQLYPDPDGEQKYVNLSDVEVGDFLDQIFWDRDNTWAHESLRQSAIGGGTSGYIVKNLIATPPTPNPPPLTVPIGMRATHVMLDELSLSGEGAFVIMGKEVFTTDQFGAYPYAGFVHLKPAAQAGSATDEPFPPNPAVIWTPPFMDRYENTGPVANSSTVGAGAPFGSRQQIGNFLFLADRSNNTVHVVNSNTMDQITTLTGLSSPDAVAITADLKSLYVSNSGGGTVSVFDVDPQSDTFLYEVAEVYVGDTPKGICCQPDLEDVFVCNYGNNTISIINPATNTVRKTLSSLLNRPWDLVLGPRQNNFGFGTQVFHGYITNFGGDEILIYESGPDGYGGVGYDDILGNVPETGENGQVFEPMLMPRGICWDPTAGGQYPLTGGVYVAHSNGSKAYVSRVEFTSQQAPWGPIFLIANSGSVGGTPGFGKRIFVITAQWGGAESTLSGIAATDVTLLDYNRSAWLHENWGGNLYTTNLGDFGTNPSTIHPINNKHPMRLYNGAFSSTFVPDRLFVSYQYSPVIDMLDTSSSQVMKSITGLPYGVRAIKTYFKY